MANAAMRGSLVGADLLALITAGMYTNPLAIYREYIQNAADAIADFGHTHSGKVEIELDPSRLVLRIRDNGPGLSHAQALRALIPIARSEKRRGVDRGFRGIGRLAGLAFAESVTFFTRSLSDQQVTRVTWQGPQPQLDVDSQSPINPLIQRSVKVDKLPGVGWPPHFFEVKVSDIGRYAAGLILNRDAVRAYIGEVCPVPISPNFPFSSKIEDLFQKDEEPMELRILLNDDLRPVTRRFDKSIRLPNGHEDAFRYFEEIHIPALDGRGHAAAGWIAHSSYLGVIPKDNGIRGLRVRVGNIQVGDETLFDHLFPEDRFNRWCVGELHILDPRIIPNGRRDHFEPGPHNRNLENHVGAIARRIMRRCRYASAARNQERRLQDALQEIKDTYDLAASGYLCPKGASSLVKVAVDRLQRVKETVTDGNGHANTILDRLDELAITLDTFEARPDPLSLGGIAPSDVAAYRRVFQTLADVSPSPRVAKELMDAVVGKA